MKFIVADIETNALEIEEINRRHTSALHARDTIAQEVKFYNEQGFDPRGTVKILKRLNKLYGLHF